MKIQEAAELGGRELLVALRDRIAVCIDEGCAPRDLVGLTRRLMDIAIEIDALDAKEPRPRLTLVEDAVFDGSVI